MSVLRTSQQPPGYPLAILATSWPIRAVSGGPTPENMALAAQIASCLFGVLLVVPMVGFGTEIIDRRFGLASAALFQCLPAWVRFTSDGLSEAMFLFFIAVGLWAAARSFRTGSAWSFLETGLAAGMAFLTRPEGAELAGAVAVVIVGAACLARVSWTSSTVSMASLAIGFLILAGPFVVATGRITNKPTGRFLLGDPTAEKSFFGKADRPPVLLAAWWQDAGDPNRNRTLWATQTLLTETAASSRQFGLLLSLIGLAVWHRRIRNSAGGAVLIVLSAAHAILLIRMTSSVGYLSERHTALIVLTGCFPATLGLMEVVDWLCRRSGGVLRVSPVLATLVLVAAAAAMPSLAKPLHGNRAGHRAAGQWLAKHAPGEAGIRDPFCWGRYYSGRDFTDSAADDPDLQYVIVELSDNQHSRLPLLTEARAKAAAGELVYHWPESKPVEKASVAVYRWVRPPANPTASRPSPPAGGGE
ncbi:MAG: glycosyltransferase family 39 protein [Gemmataceae bacterium]|nr:glycosyltransferase family 39 protein [Gemmataceae bacterium]